MAYVKCVLSAVMRAPTSDARALVWMDSRKRRMNQSSEYMYMGSMAPMAAMQKKRREVCSATGVYAARATSMAASVSAATRCFSLISLASALELFSTLMAVSSSRMLPSLDDSTCRMRFSTSFSCRWFSAPCTISAFFCSCRSGRSCATTMPSSWSARPSGVIRKLTSVTLVDTSGR